MPTLLEVTLTYIMCDRCVTPIIQHDPRHPLADQRAVDKHLMLPDHYPFDLSVYPESAPIKLEMHGNRPIVIYTLQNV